MLRLKDINKFKRKLFVEIGENITNDFKVFTQQP